MLNFSLTSTNLIKECTLNLTWDRKSKIHRTTYLSIRNEWVEIHLKLNQKFYFQVSNTDSFIH